MSTKLSTKLSTSLPTNSSANTSLDLPAAVPTPSPLSSKQIEKISKALGDGNRLKILHFISNEGGCGECSDLPEVVDLAQPSISHHVKILVESGLIEQEKEGRNYKYTLNSSLLDSYISILNDLKTV